MLNSVSLEYEKIKNIQKLADLSIVKALKDKRFSSETLISILDPHHKEFEERKKFEALKLLKIIIEEKISFEKALIRKQEKMIVLNGNYEAKIELLHRIWDSSYKSLMNASADEMLKDYELNIKKLQS